MEGAWGGGSIDFAFRRLKEACTLLRHTQNLVEKEVKQTTVKESTQVGYTLEEGIGENRQFSHSHRPPEPKPINGIKPIYLDGRWIQ